MLDLGAHLLDDAHRLVTEHVAGLEERPEHLVEVQVGAAQPGGGDPNDGVRGLLDARVGDLLDPDVLVALPGKCLHWLLPRKREPVLRDSVRCRVVGSHHGPAARAGWG